MDWIGFWVVFPSLTLSGSIKLYCDSFWKIIDQNNPFIIISVLSIQLFFFSAVQSGAAEKCIRESEKKATNEIETALSRLLPVSFFFCCDVSRAFFSVSSSMNRGNDLRVTVKDGLKLVMKIWENNEIRFTIFYLFFICADEKERRKYSRETLKVMREINKLRRSSPARVHSLFNITLWDHTVALALSCYLY